MSFKLNRSDLNFLTNRILKKDTAALLGVSPSTLSRWKSKDDKGNFKKKSLRTKTDYSELIADLKDKLKNTKPVKSIKDKKDFVDKNEIEIPTKFKQDKTTEYTKAVNSIHIAFKAKKFQTREIFNKIVELCRDDINNGEKETNCQIKLGGEFESSEGDQYKDYAATDLYPVQLNGRILTQNIKELIQSAGDLAFAGASSRFDSLKTLSEIIINLVRHITNQTINPTKDEIDGSIKFVK